MKKTEASLVVMSGGRLKSIPLSAMTSEMWTGLFGGEAGQDGSPAFFYEKVPWLFAGVNLIANAAGSMPLRWLNAGGEATDAPDAKWTQSFGDLMNAVVGDLVMYGAAYVFRGNNRRGIPTELRRLLPTTVKPEIDAVKGLIGFTRSINGQQMPFELDDLIYIWEPNRLGEIGPGTSRARAALAAAGALAGIDTSTAVLFNSGAMRPTIAFFKDSMQDAEVEKAESVIKRRLQGVKNAFGFAAVSGEVSFATLGDKPRDLVMPELTDSKRQDVSTALGVPQTLVFSNAANYATAQQDVLSFYDMTVIPAVRRVLSAMNSQCFEGMGYTVETAEDELEFYQQMQGDQVTALAQMLDRRVIDINEFRERVGFAPLEDPIVEEPEPEPQTDDSEDLPEPEDNPDDRQQRDEMRAWQRFVTRRIRDGRPLRAFETQFIPATTRAAIEGQLEAATDVQAVRAIFDHHAHFVGYP